MSSKGIIFYVYLFGGISLDRNLKPGFSFLSILPEGERKSNSMIDIPSVLNILTLLREIPSQMRYLAFTEGLGYIQSSRKSGSYSYCTEFLSNL